MKIKTAVLLSCLIALMADMAASHPPRALAPSPGSGLVCRWPLVPGPKPCGRDEDCPQYFVQTCGYDKYKGQIMVFSGDCYMNNYNCRTDSHFEAVDLTYCKSPPVSHDDWYQ